MDLDDEGGTTFLRVLIHLIMQDYPPLVSGSLQLLFKHFSQRAEVLQAFKQVSGFLTSLTLLYLIITLFLDLYILHVVEYVCVCVCWQVQLLVSEQDVENYKQIKADLDQLRLTVEKSELWVEKNGGYGTEDATETQAKEQNMEVCPLVVGTATCSCCLKLIGKK